MNNRRGEPSHFLQTVQNDHDPVLQQINARLTVGETPVISSQDAVRQKEMHILLLQPWLLAMGRFCDRYRWYIPLDVHGSTERLTPRALDRVLSPKQCAARSESTYSEEYVV